MRFCCRCDAHDVQYQYIWSMAVSLVHFANQARAFQKLTDKREAVQHAPDACATVELSVN